MEHFDPEQYLALVEKYQVSHTQLVPTMFSRMLKLPEAVRTSYNLSSLEVAIHGAAPCPIQVKDEMIRWWGPIIYEYYGATEGLGFAWCDTEEWLARPDTVGRIVLGEVHILDDDSNECPIGTHGEIWFKNRITLRIFQR
jgi:long-chain acyl-CoA synthetase